MMRCWLVLACVGLFAQPAVSSSQPSIALIAGRVVDAGSGAPVAGAIVSISGAALGSRLAPRLLTDAQGRFLYRNLPAGTFRLTAVKAGFADGAFGRRRPEGPAQDMELRAGERATDVTITLWKFAAISGTVHDEAGEPVVGVPVFAWRQARIGGRAVLRPVGTRPATDDRGMYRVSNVLPGEYVVGIGPRSTSVPASVADALRGGTVDPAARSEINLAMMTAGRAGTIFTGPDVSRVGEQIVTFVNGLAVPGGALPTAVYPPTYHPAAQTPARATTVTVSSGEERADVDIQLQPVPASSISGTLMGPDGPVAHLAVRLDASGYAGLLDTGGAGTVTDPNGAFTFVAVPAGAYTLRATRVPRSPGPQRESVRTTVGNTTLVFTTEGPAPPAPLPTEPTLWAALPVQVGGDPITGLLVTLQPGLQFVGRVEFEGSAERPGAEQLQRIRIMPTPLDAFAPSGNRPAQIEADGQFRTLGMPGGRYILRVTSPPKGWTVKSANWRARDLLDLPAEVGTSDVSGIVVTFTDRRTELSGNVIGSSGPDASSSVIVFPADPALLEAGTTSRRLVITRTSPAGAFTVRTLPPGAYYVAAVPDESAADWNDPRFLEGLTANATRVQLEEGAARTVDLRTVMPRGDR
jgi:protocatechuate 3,4-dioxygenase beta subunit